MQVVSKLRYAHISPQKCRLVANRSAKAQVEVVVAARRPTNQLAQADVTVP